MVNWDKKVDLKKLPDRFKSALVNRRSPIEHGWDEMTPKEREEKIQWLVNADLSVRDVLDDYLSWEGVIGYTTIITLLIDACMEQK